MDMGWQIDLIGEFKADLRTRGMSEDTIETYPKYIKAFSAFVKGNLREVNEDLLVKYLEYLRKRKLEQSSIKRYYSALSTFYDFLVFKKYIATSPVTSTFRKHYLRSYKSHDAAQRRQCLSIEQAKTFVESILDPREKAVVVLLLKTGLRRKELSELDLKDVDMGNMTIHLKPTGKRSNEIVYFDEETANVLNRWLKRRKIANKNKEEALFLDRFGDRLSPEAINRMFTKHAIAVGLHDPESDRLQDRLSPHSCRHFFTTRMLEAGCPREYVQELRGDVGRAAVDIYYHIDKKKLQQAYLDCIPKLGIL
jgi:integrase/recombinase XerD